MGVSLVPGGGASCRVWAPRAQAVFLTTADGRDWPLQRDSGGYWNAHLAQLQEGDRYRFRVVGSGSTGYKRDPYARELDPHGFPDSQAVLRSDDSYPWHDQQFVVPDFTNLVIYQLHVGAYFIQQAGKSSTFLDVTRKIPYLSDLGINLVQLLPIDETETDPSLGYDGADLFSPDFPYIDRQVEQHLPYVNQLLAAKQQPPLTADQLRPGPNQLKALVDLCHLYGLAVVFDVVYNHAGGFVVNGQPDDHTLYYWDRVPNVGNNNDSLYFTDQDRGTGGLSFALWNQDVRQFLLSNASYWVQQFHVDGFRYDEISSLLSMNRDSGWSFCRDLTDTLRGLKPRLLQNAEFWPFEFSDYPKATADIVRPVSQGGAGFDVVQHDQLRNALRRAVEAASSGAAADIDMTSIANALTPGGLDHGWRAVTCIENHDIVKTGAEKRVPSLADGSDSRSRFAAGRTRFALGVLLTAPGIPQLFMGQEFLEGQQWNWHPSGPGALNWAGAASDPVMKDHFAFTRALLHLRWRYPALRQDNVNAFHVHDANRVMAFHRWWDGEDLLVVATLSEAGWPSYRIGFPHAGEWTAVFRSDGNTDTYSVDANGGPLHGLPTSAAVTIPAMGFIVLARS